MELLKNTKKGELFFLLINQKLNKLLKVNAINKKLRTKVQN